jgi:antitoxin component of MazEF toxin-antitoxin module
MPRRALQEPPRLRIVRWGNGYGFRLPYTVLLKLGLKVGDRLDVVGMSPGVLVLRIVEQGPESYEEDVASPDWAAVQRELRNVMERVERLSGMVNRRGE